MALRATVSAPLEQVRIYLKLPEAFFHVPSFLGNEPIGPVASVFSTVRVMTNMPEEVNSYDGSTLGIVSSRVTVFTLRRVSLVMSF